MEKYVWTFVNYQQNDWLEKLAISEFAANNNELASIKLSLFFVFKNLYSSMSFDIINLSNTNTYKQIYRQKDLDISRNIKTTWEFI